MQILGFIGVFWDNKHQVAVKKKHRKCGKEEKSKGRNKNAIMGKREKIRKKQ